MICRSLKLRVEAPGLSPQIMRKKLITTFIFGLFSTLGVGFAWKHLRQKHTGDNPVTALEEDEEEEDEESINQKEEQNPGSSFSSSSSVPVGDEGFEYDVFVSFRGKDTRKGFISHLAAKLVERGIHAFVDEMYLKKGEEIGSLIQCIERSKVFVIVFSKRYTESRWCLMEVAKMVACGRKIIPVFYHVSPKDVRCQTGLFGKGFARHQNNGGAEKVKEWRRALGKVGETSGHVFNSETNGTEAELVNVILKDVEHKVSRIPLEVAKYPIGMALRVDHVKKLLDLNNCCNENDGVCMVGIHGEGGLGKTSISKAVYNKLRQRFQESSFLFDVREKAHPPGGLASLQEELIKDILHENCVLKDAEHGTAIIRQRMKLKRVLLVLDDVDSKDQLDKLAGDGGAWFGGGSRIIISTRNEVILDMHRVDRKYKPEELDADESLELFSWHAFARKEPLPGYEELSKRVVSYSGGLPLALEVFGPIFFTIRKHKEWTEKLQSLKDVQHKDLSNRLRVSYEALEEEEKCVFLDIACCFMGKRPDYPRYLWEAMGFHPSTTIMALQHKSLLKIERNNYKKQDEFWMHEQIRDMGRNIVKGEALHPPGLRSRLWEKREILPLLEDGLEEQKNAIQVLMLNSWGATLVDGTAFARMRKLRSLSVSHLTFKDDSLLHFPRTIRCLHLTECRSKTTLTLDTSGLQQLVELDLSGGEFCQLAWIHHPPEEQKGSRKEAKIKMPKLKVLDLSGCGNLTATPKFCGLLGLEKLLLDDCRSLRQIDDSIGQLINLAECRMCRCVSLKHLPDNILKLKNLETFYLGGSNNIRELPEMMGERLESLKRLDLSCTAVRNLPILGKQMMQLVTLCLMGVNLEELPEEIATLKLLQVLKIEACELERVPESIGTLMCLEELHLGWNQIRELPESIGKMSSLTDLNLEDNKELCGLPETLGCLKSLRKVDLGGCTSVKKLPASTTQLTRLNELNLIDTKLEELPEDIGNLKSLKTLSLVRTPLKKLPDSIGSLVNLEVLKLSTCCHLEQLPDTIGGLKSLKELQVDGTPLLAVPNSINGLSSLRSLNLSGTKITEITQTSNIEGLSSLEDLRVNECPNLCSLPQLPHSLEFLRARDSTALVRLPDMTKLGKLRQLDLKNCKKLIDNPSVDSLFHSRYPSLTVQLP